MAAASNGVRVILAVDPGISCCGCALFASDGVLHRAWLARSALTPAAGIVTRCAEMALQVTSAVHDHIDVFVGEWPQIYTRRKSKGDPNVSLLPLAGVIGGIAACMSDATLKQVRDGMASRRKLLEQPPFA